MAKRIKAVLLIFALLLPSASPIPAGAGILLDRVVAIVHRDVITWSELYKSMEFDYYGQLSTLSPEEQRKMLARNERSYLDRLIDMKLQLNEARRLNIGVSLAEVDAGVMQIRQSYGLSEEMFLAALKKQGFTIDEYRRKLSEQIVLNKLINFEIRAKIIVSEGEIERHIREKDFKVEVVEGARIRQILLKPAGAEGRESVEERAKGLLDILAGGESFKDVAMKHSDGPFASSGGDLGFIRRDDLPELFLSVVDVLSDGEYSDPFWSEKGLHIIYLEEKVVPEVVVKESVRQFLAKKKFEEKLKDWMRSLRSDTYIKVNL